jgi:hypothetical protein
MGIVDGGISSVIKSVRSESHENDGGKSQMTMKRVENPMYWDE